ncbi:methyltransferase [Alteromonas gilva]|uniref:Ribosomal RNA small subunit methyltransferase C n=1 Tax=Alteromonas gilva TaxID=2987522 RepID=A0ABT5KYA1_9ALTE|nr:methyltransferase [Alteromonas gilva]MDC8829754.1 methyltransferase [Alteromonas gilva]
MSLSPQSQLIKRNIDQFEHGNWLIINPDDAALFSLLADVKLTVLHQYFDVFSQSGNTQSAVTFDSRDIVADSANLRVERVADLHTHVFAPFISAVDASDVLIFMPKAKAHLTMLLNMAAALCGNGGRVHVVGENKGGIKSAGKILTPLGDVSKLDSARHCSWLTCDISSAPAGFDIHDWSAVDTYTHNNHEWQVCSLPGVFSHRELDQGTAMLLSKLPAILSGKVLDFACGAGVIASYLQTLGCKASFQLLDVSALALWSSAQTLALNHCQGIIIGADTLQGIDGRYSAIVTNPPFHTGVKTDYRVTREFINTAKQHLLSKGKLFVVANRFLPYAELLEEQFAQPSMLAQDNRFAVYFVQS